MRNLLIILAVWLLYVVVRQTLAKNQARRSQNHTSPKNNAENIASPTVKCEHCGVYIPIQESVMKHNHYYCSEQHALVEQDPK